MGMAPSGGSGVRLRRRLPPPLGLNTWAGQGAPPGTGRSSGLRPLHHRASGRTVPGEVAARLTGGVTLAERREAGWWLEIRPATASTSPHSGAPTKWRPGDIVVNHAVKCRCRPSSVPRRGPEVVEASPGRCRDVIAELVGAYPRSRSTPRRGGPAPPLRERSTSTTRTSGTSRVSIPSSGTATSWRSFRRRRRVRRQLFLRCASTTSTGCRQHPSRRDLPTFRQPGVRIWAKLEGRTRPARWDRIVRAMLDAAERSGGG